LSRPDLIISLILWSGEICYDVAILLQNGHILHDFLVYTINQERMI